MIAKFEGGWVLKIAGRMASRLVPWMPVVIGA
jgi:hypothetical protein